VVHKPVDVDGDAGTVAPGVARTTGGHIVAISVPAPTDRFNANEQRIVEALQVTAHLTGRR
jgi:IclR family acetate operon transcriptional repressor